MYCMHECTMVALWAFRVKVWQTLQRQVLLYIQFMVTVHPRSCHVRTYVKSELFTLVLIMLLIFTHTVHMDPPMLYVLTLSILLHTTVYTLQ